MAERSVCSAKAAVYVSSGGNWAPKDGGISKVDIYLNPANGSHRVVAIDESNPTNYPINSAIFADLNYVKQSDQFHAWTDQTQTTFGLNFSALAEAQNFEQTMNQVVAAVRGVGRGMGGSGGAGQSGPGRSPAHDGGPRAGGRTVAIGSMMQSLNAGAGQPKPGTGPPPFGGPPGMHDKPARASQTMALGGMMSRIGGGGGGGGVGAARSPRLGRGGAGAGRRGGANRGSMTQPLGAMMGTLNAAKRSPSPALGRRSTTALASSSPSSSSRSSGQASGHGSGGEFTEAQLTQWKNSILEAVRNDIAATKQELLTVISLVRMDAFSAYADNDSDDDSELVAEQAQSAGQKRRLSPGVKPPQFHKALKSDAQMSHPSRPATSEAAVSSALPALPGFITGPTNTGEVVLPQQTHAVAGSGQRPAANSSSFSTSNQSKSSLPSLPSFITGNKAAVNATRTKFSKTLLPPQLARGRRNKNTEDI